MNSEFNKISLINNCLKNFTIFLTSFAIFMEINFFSVNTQSLQTKT